MTSKAKLKAEIAQLRQSIRDKATIDDKAREARHAEFLRTVSTSQSTTISLVFPDGVIIPAIVSDVEMTREGPYDLWDCGMKLYPQPPK